MNSRPLMHYNAAELEELFSLKKSSKRFLITLSEELQYRKSKRAGGMQERVIRAIADFSQSDMGDEQKVSTKNASGDFIRSSVSVTIEPCESFEKLTDKNCLIQNLPLPRERSATAEIQNCSISDKKIVELVQESEASVRLNNVISAAARDNRLPATTVNDYLALGKKASHYFLKLPNCGRRTTRELHDIVKSFMESSKSVSATLHRNHSENPINLQKDVLDTKLEDLVYHSLVSARVENVIQKAAKLECLPATTVGEYLALYRPTHVFAKLQNFGRKSANELDHLIKRFVEEISETTQFDPRTKKYRPLFNQKALRDLSLELSDVELNSSLLKNNISEGLRKCMSNGNINAKNLITYIYEYEKLKKNIEDNFFDEYEKYCNKEIYYYLNKNDVSMSEFRLFVDLLREENSPEKFLEKIHISQFGHQLPQTFPENSLKNATYEEIVQLGLGELGEREFDIISKRYGLDAPAKTLQEVGDEYSVTRERIRQIQSKALRRLRKSKFGNALLEALARQADFICSEMSGNSVAIKQYKLPALLQLAFDIIRVKPSVWLNDHAIRYGDGWYLGDETQEDLDNAFNALSNNLKHRRLPLPISELAQNCDHNLVQAFAYLNNEFGVYLGYITKGYLGARSKRTIALHRILSGLGRFGSLGELIENYRAQFSHDQCSIRDMQIVMADAPHLFIQIVDDQWATIGAFDPTSEEHSEARLLDQSDGNEPEAEPTDGSKFNDGAIGHIIHEVLSERGPLPFLDLFEEVRNRMPADRSESSIGPILLTSGSFYRPLPGVYCLAEQRQLHTEIGLQQPSYLLNEKQCKYYVMSRWAGEDYFSYSFWTPLSEYAWCRWAKQNADPELFESLLAICEPRDWPASKEEQDHWLRLKARDGHYSLQMPPKFPLEKTVPSPDRILAAVFAAQETGHLSWCSANRILKKRVDSHVSAGLLAALVALEVLKPAKHWQLKHELAPGAKQVRQILELEIFQNGEILESSDGFSKLLADTQQKAETIPVGWIDLDDLCRLLNKLAHGEIDIVDKESSEEDVESLEDMLAKRRQDEDRAQKEDLLKKLID